MPVSPGGRPCGGDGGEDGKACAAPSPQPLAGAGADLGGRHVSNGPSGDGAMKPTMEKIT